MLLRGLAAPALAAHRAEALLGALRRSRRRWTACGSASRPAAGIAVAPGHAAACRELLRRADVAMYQAKRAGQRIATYAPSPGHRRRRPARPSAASCPRAVADQRVRRQLPADRRPRHRRGRSAPRRWPAGTTPSTATSTRCGSSRRSNAPACSPAFAEAVLDQALVAVRRLADGRLRPAGRGQRLAAQPARPALPRRGARPGCAAHDVPPDRLVLELTETLTLSQLDVVDRVLQPAARRRASGSPWTTSAPATPRSSLLCPDPGPRAEDRPQLRHRDGDLRRGGGRRPLHPRPRPQPRPRGRRRGRGERTAAPRPLGAGLRRRPGPPVRPRRCRPARSSPRSDAVRAAGPAPSPRRCTTPARSSGCQRPRPASPPARATRRPVCQHLPA